MEDIKNDNDVSHPFDPRKILSHPHILKSILNGKIPFPITMEVDLVDGACNNKCIFCCFGSSTKSESYFIKEEPLFDALEIAAQKGTKAIELVGGSEPTMHPKIAIFMKKISELGLQIGTSTNGLLLDRLFPSADTLTWARISLDAGTPETYQTVHGVATFNRVLDNLKTFTTEHIDSTKVGLGYLVVPENAALDEMRRFAEIGAKYKLGYIVFRPPNARRRYGWDMSYLDAIYESIRQIEKEFGDDVPVRYSRKIRWNRAITQKREHKGQCFTSVLTTVIKATGDIPYCNLRREDTNSSIGNIYDQPIDEIWGGEKHQHFFDTVNVEKCPIPCIVDDYRDVLYAYKDEILTDSIPDITFHDSAHPNFY